VGAERKNPDQCEASNKNPDERSLSPGGKIKDDRPGGGLVEWNEVVQDRQETLRRERGKKRKNRENERFRVVVMGGRKEQENYLRRGKSKHNRARGQG